MICTECARPWGIVLERGEEPNDERQRAAQLALENELREILDTCESADAIFSLSTIEQCYPERVVFVTDALADFVSKYLGAFGGEGSAWWRVDQVDIPQWLLAGRRRRWAYLWDCCGLDLGRVVSVEGTQVVL